MSVTITRYEDWAEKLAAYLRSMENATFEQGSVDCGHFTADAVLAMTGVDLYQPLRGQYTTVRGYLTLLHGLGYKSCQEYVGALLPEVLLPFAGRGDVVLRMDGGLEAMGICLGQASIFLNVAGGLAKVPTNTCKMAWRVG